MYNAIVMGDFRRFLMYADVNKYGKRRLYVQKR